MKGLGNIEVLILVQLGVEVILILFVVFLLFRFKRSGHLNGLNKGIESAAGLISETDKICKTLSANLKEKKALVDKLLSDLDRRIKELQRLTNSPAPSAGREAPVLPGRADGPYTNVVELSRYGLSVDEIAERLSMTSGEVELVLGLAREKREANNRR